LLGFDLVHAWRNRENLRSADVVWTHTEREHLAAALLFLAARRPAPKLIAQCVWLFDKWNRLSMPKRALYRRLLKCADVVTTQSPEDLKVARAILADQPAECILSGGAVEWMSPPREAPNHRPLHLVSLGNDMHRDWETLLQAVGGRNEYELVIATGKLPRKLLRNASNVKVVNAKTAAEVRCLYRWADVVVVPLKYNRHASGITVVFEATISGVPVVVTDTGGLRAYFSDAEVSYVPLNRIDEMRRTFDYLASDRQLCVEMVAKAQSRMLANELTKQGYASRHRKLTEQLLRREESFSRLPSGADTSAGTDPLIQQQVKVFVFLGYGFGADDWRDRYERGLIPGLN
jgi:glycosyltransferase involved in cell wall biosynthesis